MRCLSFPAEEAWIIFELKALFESYLQMMQKSLWVFIFLKREFEGRTPLRSWKKAKQDNIEQRFLPLHLPNLEANDLLFT